MKTLLLSEIFPPQHGGSGRWFYELYRRLERSDYRLLVGEHRDAHAFDSEHRESLDIERLPLSSLSWGIRSLTGLGFYWRTYRAVRRVVRKENIAMLHCGRCLPEGVLGWIIRRLHGLPYLCFVHGEDIQTASQSRELSMIIRRVFASAELLIANSHNTSQLLTNEWGVPAANIHVLHPGMDAERFVPADEDPEFLARMSWLDRLVILTVGRLQRRKGHDVLIQALPDVLKAVPEALYVIVGSGEEKANLEILASRMGVQDSVQFLESVDDKTLIACYQQCSAFVLPNRTDGHDIEGFGMVLAEAQSCGKPVIAGDSGGTRETMIIGKTGFIVDCRQPGPLAESLIDLLTDEEKRRQMGVDARAHASRSFDWALHTEKAKALFERCAPEANQSSKSP